MLTLDKVEKRPELDEKKQKIDKTLLTKDVGAFPVHPWESRPPEKRDPEHHAFIWNLDNKAGDHFFELAGCVLDLSLKDSETLIAAIGTPEGNAKLLDLVPGDDIPELSSPWLAAEMQIWLQSHKEDLLHKARVYKWVLQFKREEKIDIASAIDLDERLRGDDCKAEETFNDYNQVLAEAGEDCAPSVIDRCLQELLSLDPKTREAFIKLAKSRGARKE